MITSTEDKFDVNYDIFSFTGRAALIGGGLYALDKSIKDGVFKPGSKNLGKYNNDYINNLTSLLDKDVKPVSRQDVDLSAFKPKSYFSDSPSKPRGFSVSGVDDEVLSLKKLHKGGYKGMSSGLIQELEYLQNEIRTADGSDEFIHLRKNKPEVRSGRMTIQQDKNGKLVSVGIDSLAGKQVIEVIDENGMMTFNNNKYIARAQYRADGLKAGKPIGLDQSKAHFLAKNYTRQLRGDLTFGEIKSLQDQALTYNGKVYDEVTSGRIDPNVEKNILNSMQNDVFSPSNRVVREAMMKDAAINNKVGSATNLADGIIRTMGDAIGEIDGLGYTSNPNQLFRANTFYIDKQGNHKSLVNLNVAFLDDDQLSEFQRIGKEKFGLDFGDLAKEELIANSRLMGSVGDNSRSLQIRGDYLTDSSEFILEEMRKTTGLSKEDFEARIRQKGFDAFDDQTQKRLRKIGTNDYKDYLNKEIQESTKKRQALLYANGTSDEFRKGRRELIAKREALTNVKRNKNFRMITKGKSRDISRNRKQFILHQEAQSLLKSGNLDKELFEINKTLGEVNKKFNRKILRSDEYKEATKLKAQGKLNQAIIENGKQIEDFKSRAKTANHFGLSVDKKSIQYSNGKLKDLTFNNLHIGNNGEITFALLKTTKVGQGVKGIDPSGETKAVYKTSSDHVSDILKQMHLDKHGTIEAEALAAYEGTHIVAKREAMKTEVIDRNLQDVISSVRSKNAVSANADVSRLLAEFDSTAKADGDYEKLIRGLGEVSGGNIHDLAGTQYTSGFIKNKLLAFGSSAEELGAGGLGFVAERHFQLMQGSGLNNFARSVFMRRDTLGSYRTYQDFQTVKGMMFDTKNQGFINFDNLRDTNDPSFMKFISDVFPSTTEGLQGKAEGIKNRADILRKYGKVENGAAFVSLNGSFEGISKIPIFTDESMLGLIGEQIGYDGDYKKYTEIDRLTKDIIHEAHRSGRDEGRLRQMISNYKEAVGQMEGTLSSKILKGKVKNSMVGQASSGSAALNTYADNLFNKNIKHAAPSVAAVSANQFKKMFGEDAYLQFMKTGKSNSWAFAIREPVEGLSGLPVNVVVAKYFEGIKDLDDKRIAFVANRQNSLLNMVFGDYDGDQLSLIAATDNMSTDEIRRLATSNDVDAVAFREAQELKTRFRLKGAHSKSLLSHDLAELTLANYHAKNLEKGFVGIASNSLKNLHEMNRKMHSNMVDGKLVGSEAFFKTEAILHTFAENIIKGKAQSADDLKNKRSQQVLNAIIGGDEFKNASTTDRIKHFRQFADEIMLGDASEFADRLRAGETGEVFLKEVTDKLKGDAKRASEIVNGDWFAKATNDESMEAIMKVSGLVKGSGSEIDQATANLFSKQAGEAQHSLLKLAEQTQESLEDSKKMFHGFLGNATKYALAPAAVLGLMGTVFGARSDISSDVEFSDVKRQHEKTLASDMFASPIKSGVNMRQPTHMKPEVKGQGSRGFSIEKYAATHGTSKVRYQDDTRSFDYHDMQDKIKRGY